MDAPPVQYVRTRDGCDVAYTACGSGPPLVYLPAVFNHFSLQWRSGIRREAFEALAERFRLYLYDGRGQGLSSRGSSNQISIESLECDLDAVLGLVEGSRFVLLGPAATGLIALRYASLHPERVAALILWNYVDTKIAPAAPALRAMTEMDWEFFVESMARTSYPTKDPALVKQVLRETTTQAECLALIRGLRSGSAPETLLHNLRVPTLVLASRAGDRAPPNEEAGRWVAAMIPNARLQLLDGTDGGWDCRDGRPPAAVVAIEQFIDSLALHAHDAFNTAPQDDSGLSRREIEVLALIAAGKSNQQIADELVISFNTVQRHVSNILDKTGTTNRTEAAGYARDRNLA